ncbi:sugar ABC transporter permease [Mesobacillus boroniphilus]|uniref:Sugar ABC transporter permease n=1 Tax=Mesobacillus boroniphilus TaxID=308892 RepID=A0A944CM60_9BACI|nr:sugar ABC transporter permease [Mesobacillus boroniphilus]MBS8265724.1 sugar ABC transporter permease [Mesobacillus boroniphilus]
MNTLVTEIRAIITKEKGARRRIKFPLTLWLFILPALTPLTIFWIYPMLYSLYISFTDWDYMSTEYNFVGFSNYADLMTNPLFYGVLWNTLYFSVGVVVPSVFGGLLLAMLVVKKQKGMGFYRTLIFSPWVTPAVAVSIVWSWIYEPQIGLANWLLTAVNLPALEWTSSTTWAMPAVIIVTIWKGLGWCMIFYLNALKKVPESLYEAAALDGASSWQKFLNVTLPLISPTTLFLVIITAVDALQAYDQIQVLTQGGPAGSTRTILYMYYQSAFEQFNMGQATAVATVLVILTASLSLLQFMFSRKWVHYE